MTLFRGHGPREPFSVAFDAVTNYRVGDFQSSETNFGGDCDLEGKRKWAMSKLRTREEFEF